MMRTAIRASWVVDYRDGGHHLLRDGVVVVEGDRILEVGSSYDGPVDVEYSLPNEVLIPGLIDTHVHTGTRATHRLISDTGDDHFYGQPFLHWAVTAPGVASPGGDGVPVDGRSDEMACRFTAIELLRSGVTTFVEVGARASLQRVMAEVANETGIRAYLGPGVTSAYYSGGDGTKRWDRSWDSDRELGLLRAAEQFAADYDGGTGGLVRATFVARELENCSEQLMRHLASAARQLGAPLVTHAAYSPIEWQCINQEHGKTPLQYLDATGALDSNLLIEHGNLIAENHPFWSSRNDLRLLGGSGASVSHSPINLLRRGRTFDSLDGYREAGVNLCLGADTYPRDLFMQMRAASYMGKAVTGDYRAANAAMVFEMATLGGADALGRPDLGRIAPGAAADLVSVSLQPKGSLRMGVVRDPISAIVDCAVGDDVRLVMVAGKVRVEAGEVLDQSVPELIAEAQQSADDYWSTVQDWHPLGHGANQMAPLSFPDD